MFEKLNQLIPFGSFIRNKSIQNFLFLAIIQSSNVLISIISVPLLIQSIGVDQFGLVNLSLSVIILLNILVGFGYNLSAPRQVAISQQDKEALSHLVSNIFSAKFILALTSALLILLGIVGFGLFEGYQVILIYSLLILFSEAALPLWFFQGMEKMKLISIANIFSKLLFLMGIVLFIHDPSQSQWVNFMLGFFGLFINILLLIYIHWVMEIRFYRPEFSAIWKSLNENILLFFSNLASYISINGGLIILSFFSSAETLGMYSLAEKVAMILRLFPALVIQAFIPNASKLYHEDQTAFFSFLINTYFRVILGGFLISVLTFLSAPWIIRVLSRSELQESVLYLQILSFLPFLACINVANVTLLLVADLKQLLFRASWMMCAYMIFASTLLTAWMGPLGLCYGILSTEIIAFFICLFILYRRKKELLIGLFS